MVPMSERPAQGGEEQREVVDDEHAAENGAGFRDLPYARDRRRASPPRRAPRTRPARAPFPARDRAPGEKDHRAAAQEDQPEQLSRDSHFPVNVGVILLHPADRRTGAPTPASPRGRSSSGSTNRVDHGLHALHERLRVDAHPENHHHQRHAHRASRAALRSPELPFFSFDFAEEHALVHPQHVDRAQHHHTDATEPRNGGGDLKVNPCSFPCRRPLTRSRPPSSPSCQLMNNVKYAS